jgi:fructose 5-dehydrogenase large subunit
MGTDAKTSVVDPDCRAHDHDNLFLPGGAAMPSGTASNSTLTMSALALKAADAIVAQLKHGPS